VTERWQVGGANPPPAEELGMPQLTEKSSEKKKKKKVDEGLVQKDNGRMEGQKYSTSGQSGPSLVLTRLRRREYSPPR